MKNKKEATNKKKKRFQKKRKRGRRTYWCTKEKAQK
jgi:hypothetical protein